MALVEGPFREVVVEPARLDRTILKPVRGNATAFDGEIMSIQPERTGQGAIRNENSGVIEGIDHPLTPLQFHYLSLLQRMIAIKNSYQTDPSFEPWLMNAINKGIFATFRDCIEANIGEAARELLRREHQVN